MKRYVVALDQGTTSSRCIIFDRVLSSRIGAHAAAMIERGDFGKLVVVKNNVITDIPLEESAGKLKYVDPQSDIIKEAKLLGISFGDK